MTRVAMHSPATRPAAIPLEQHRTSLAASWDKLARWESASGHHILAETDARIAEDFRTGRSDPPPFQAMEHSPSALRYYP